LITDHPMINLNSILLSYLSFWAVENISWVYYQLSALLSLHSFSSSSPLLNSKIHKVRERERNPRDRKRKSAYFEPQKELLGLQIQWAKPSITPFFSLCNAIGYSITLPTKLTLNLNMTLGYLMIYHYLHCNLSDFSLSCGVVELLNYLS